MERQPCPLCRRGIPSTQLVYEPEGEGRVWELIGQNHPHWSPPDGACWRCLKKYERLMSELAAYSPQFAEGTFWIIPLPVRLDIDPRYTGKGVTMAFLDSGFYLHPDLVEPENRILGYTNILTETAGPAELWKEVAEPQVDAWHGMMTSVVAAGNGRLSRGIYRGIACQANVVLVKVGSIGRIRHDDIRRGIEWVIRHKDQYRIRVLNISCGGDYEASYLTDGLSRAAEEATGAGIAVVAAAGNKGNEPRHPVIPPASAPSVITVGGLDDNNQVDWSGFRMYHSSYGPTLDGLQKPEVIAPSIWLAAPILPGTEVARQASLLERLDLASPRQLKTLLRAAPGVISQLDEAIDRPVNELRDLARGFKRAHNMISAHYKHVDGTSFAAPIVASIVAQMIEANPSVTPAQAKLALIETARRLPRVKVDKQGWGVIHPRRAVQWVQRDGERIIRGS